MKVIMLKNVDVDIDRPRMKRVDPKYLYKNDIFDVELIEDIGADKVNLVLDDGNVLLEVPRHSFSINSSNKGVDRFNVDL